ncbi:hypothetical protein J2S01_000570 [Pectinatus haikarae]|uniref:Ribbon-helix-helix protein CopG domain-containing protein n=1 Tax=Pectinatus haikarae TaxID=349096 RepID=A0ABT9Y6U3_9FIRM|nr:hypothetical protein [Pectinatus haikarae]
MAWISLRIDDKIDNYITTAARRAGLNRSQYIRSLLGRGDNVNNINSVDQITNTLNIISNVGDSINTINDNIIMPIN